VRAEKHSPPTVSDTKAAFTRAFSRPLPGIYSTVLQELLVQQHLFRFNKTYQYNEVAALGVVSVFDQVLEGLPEAERGAVFDAYISSLQEDPKRYRADAEKLEAWARGAGGPDAITPAADGAEGQQALQRVADAVAAGNFLYTKFLAVGIFRLLELAGGKDPKALASLVAALGVPADRVNADLLTYKGVLSKLQAAKDLMAEFIAREKKKAAERAAAKEAAAAAPAVEA
jgi:photosystem II biogenesis protein Psp29